MGKVAPSAKSKAACHSVDRRTLGLRGRSVLGSTLQVLYKDPKHRTTPLGNLTGNLCMSMTPPNSRSRRRSFDLTGLPAATGSQVDTPPSSRPAATGSQVDTPPSSRSRPCWNPVRYRGPKGAQYIDYIESNYKEESFYRGLLSGPNSPLPMTRRRKLIFSPRDRPGCLKKLDCGSGAENSAVTVSPAKISAVTESPAKISSVTESPAKISSVTESPAKISAVTESAAKISAVTKSAAKISSVTKSAAKISAVTNSAAKIYSVTKSAAKIYSVTKSAAIISPAEISTVTADEAESTNNSSTSSNYFDYEDDTNSTRGVGDSLEQAFTTVFCAKSSQFKIRNHEGKILQRIPLLTGKSFSSADLMDPRRTRLKDRLQRRNYKIAIRQKRLGLCPSPAAISRLKRPVQPDVKTPSPPKPARKRSLNLAQVSSFYLSDEPHTETTPSSTRNPTPAAVPRKRRRMEQSLPTLDSWYYDSSPKRSRALETAVDSSGWTKRVHRSRSSATIATLVDDEASQKPAVVSEDQLWEHREANFYAEWCKANQTARDPDESDGDVWLIL